MKIKDIAGFNSLNAFIVDKIKRFKGQEKSFKVLFDFMFEQEQNIIAETSNGFRINKVTYGQAKEQAISFAKKLKNTLQNENQGQVVGLYMDNSLAWITTFWAILMCGFNPLLMNSRLPKEQLEKVLDECGAIAVISENQVFNKKTLIFSDIEKENEAPLNEWGQEIYFMSSGTTDNVKLCAYNAENFYYQVANTYDIVTSCPKIASNYEGHIKQLALLPFYHVFGFIAVYIWFGFFARTFVFLKDLNPETLLNTVKKHKVTHIFAVPMVWETIYSKAIKTIRARGEKTYKKFQKALSIINKNALLGGLISKFALKEIRENIFGDSVKFLISGGSAISKEALEFLNAIGYFAVNGYGMTEIAITSVETSNKLKNRNLCAIGMPFSLAEYKISDSGELLVKGRARAFKIISANKEVHSDFDEWFKTNDLAEFRNGRYYLLGRKDDLIISSSGENINPTLVENLIKLEEIGAKCLVKGKNGAVLVLELNGWLPVNKLKSVRESVYNCLKEANFESEVKEIVLTRTKLMEKNDFKVSRTKVAKKLDLGLIERLEIIEKTQDEQASELENELKEIFKEVLSEVACILVNDDFFIDLNGTSLEYFELVSIIRDRFSLRQDVFEGKGLTTVKQFAQVIIKELE